MQPIKLVIAETQYLIIEGLQSIFKRYSDLQVVGVMVNKEDLFTNLNLLNPDIVVIDPLNLEDFRVDDISTLETVCPGTRILIITDISNTDIVRKIVEIGAKGYLTKTCDEKEIIDAIHEGTLEKVKTNKMPIFGFNIPESCPGIEGKILNPIDTWHNKNEYDMILKQLANNFVTNFKKYSDKASADILSAAPKI